MKDLRCQTNHLLNFLYKPFNAVIYTKKSHYHLKLQVRRSFQNLLQISKMHRIAVTNLLLQLVNFVACGILHNNAQNYQKKTVIFLLPNCLCRSESIQPQHPRQPRFPEFCHLKRRKKISTRIYRLESLSSMREASLSFERSL